MVPDTTIVGLRQGKNITEIGGMTEEAVVKYRDRKGQELMRN